MSARELDRDNLAIWDQSTDASSSSSSNDGSRVSVISEVLDSRTKSLIAIASVTDYVASNEIVNTLSVFIYIFVF